MMSTSQPPLVDSAPAVAGALLPPEIIDLILTVLSHDYASPIHDPVNPNLLRQDKRQRYSRSITARLALYNCALVSQDFAARSRQHLWSILHLRHVPHAEDDGRPGRHISPRRLAGMVEKTPHILSWVRHLSFKIEYQHFGYIPDKRKIYPLPLFPNIESFLLSAVNVVTEWDRVEEYVRTGIWKLLAVPSLRSLDIRLLTVSKFPVHCIVQARHLAELKLPKFIDYPIHVRSSEQIHQAQRDPALDRWLDADPARQPIYSLTIRNVYHNLALILRPSSKPIFPLGTIKCLDLIWDTDDPAAPSPSGSFARFADDLRLERLRLRLVDAPLEMQPSNHSSMFECFANSYSSLQVIEISCWIDLFTWSVAPLTSEMLDVLDNHRHSLPNIHTFGFEFKLHIDHELSIQPYKFQRINSFILDRPSGLNPAASSVPQAPEPDSGPPIDTTTTLRWPRLRKLSLHFLIEAGNYESIEAERDSWKKSLLGLPQHTFKDISAMAARGDHPTFRELTVDVVFESPLASWWKPSPPSDEEDAGSEV